jgi:hypothetical protein
VIHSLVFFSVVQDHHTSIFDSHNKTTKSRTVAMFVSTVIYKGFMQRFKAHTQLLLPSVNIDPNISHKHLKRPRHRPNTFPREVKRNCHRIMSNLFPSSSSSTRLFFFFWRVDFIFRQTSKRQISLRKTDTWRRTFCWSSKPNTTTRKRQMWWCSVLH